MTEHEFKHLAARRSKAAKQEAERQRDLVEYRANTKHHIEVLKSRRDRKTRGTKEETK